MSPSHIYKGRWSVRFRGRPIIGRLVEVGPHAEGQTPYDAPWTLEAQDGPVTIRLTAPRRRFRRPSLETLQAEAERTGGGAGDEDADDTGQPDDAEEPA